MEIIAKTLYSRSLTTRHGIRPRFRRFLARLVRSGQDMGAYAGAARRRVHLATVLFRPPSGHRLGRRQARHAHILHILEYQVRTRKSIVL